jgi:DNA-binding response OmpR family regulator
MNPLRVLLVDDEEELVFTLAERLKIRGLETEAVTNGAAAIARLAERAFDVVLLDVKMPGMSGLEALKQIRAKSPQVKIILITGHGSSEDTDSGLQLGAFDYIMKPIDINILVKKMREAAEQGPQR